MREFFASLLMSLLLAGPVPASAPPEPSAIVELERQNEALRKRLRKRERQVSRLGEMVRAERKQKRFWAALARKRRPKPEPVLERADSIVAIGRSLQAQGFQVGEHPAFGGVCLSCHRGAGHREGRAIDVNCDGCAGGEGYALDRIVGRLRSMGLFVLWRTTGHFDHLHAETR